MKNVLNRLGWALAGVLALALVAMVAREAVGGPLDPSGPPGSTQSDAEPRSAIRQPDSPAGFPIVLSQPGSYYLAENIAGVDGKNGIEISADNVSLDLSGFTIAGSGAASLNGIRVTAAYVNVRVSNGTVHGWGQTGILSPAYGSRFHDLIVYETGGNGITISGHTTLTDCTVSYSGGEGIQIVAGTSEVARCNIYNTALRGIRVSGGDARITDNHVTYPGPGAAGIWLEGERNVAQGNTVENSDCCGIMIQGNGSIVYSNAVRGPNAYFKPFGPPCTGCDIAPAQSAATATSPVVNIDN